MAQTAPEPQGRSAERARVAVAALLAGIAVLSAAALLFVLIEPGSDLARLVSSALPIPDVAATEVTFDLKAAASSPTERERYLPRALTAARREVDAAPLAAKGWLDLSYVSAVRAGGLDADARSSLARSFVVAPISQEVGAWRVGYLLAHWHELDPRLQADGLSELRTLYRDDPARRVALAQAVEASPDPVGRAAGELAMAHLGWVP